MMLFNYYYHTSLFFCLCYFDIIVIGQYFKFIFDWRPCDIYKKKTIGRYKPSLDF